MPSRQPDRTSPHSLAEESAASDRAALRDDSSGSGAGASLEQFRQVLEDQRRQTAQLQSLLESRFGTESGGGAAEKVETLVSKIETLASRLDSIGNGGNGHGGGEKPALPPQVSGLMLRVGELERKITEATPEPLLKEIVFRLGSLEDALGQSPDGGGIGEIRERVKALERRKLDHSVPDARVDEIAARLERIENNPRPAVEGLIDEVLARVHSLENRAGDSALKPRLEDLKAQLESLRSLVETGGLERLKKIEDRVAAVESSPSRSSIDDQRLASLEAKIETLAGLVGRLESLESKAAEAGGREISAEWSGRLEAVEAWGARIVALEGKPAEPDPRIGEITARLEKLDALDSLAERLSKVEELPSVPPRDARVDEIESRISSLITLPERLQALESKLAEPPADPRVDEINARLGAMADVAHIGDVESRVSSLTTRLDALKMITDGLKATHRPGGSAPDPRFTELAARLASLEKNGSGGSDPRVSEILARLNTIEQSIAAPAQAAVPPDMLARIDALEKRLSGAPATGTDPIVAQLRERWEILEERMLRFEENISGGYGEGGESGDELRVQVDGLRERIEALSTGESGDLDPETVATLRELAKNPPAPGGALDLGTVKSQMTFVYFSIGMLYAICAYAGFVMLSSN